MPETPNPLNATFKYQKSKFELIKTLSKDPNKIRVGEVVVVQVSKLGGLLNKSYAVLNVDGKQIVIQQLK